LQILQLMEGEGLDYELAVIGQQFRNSPDVFGQIERDFAHRLVQFGYVESTRDYHGLLRGADMVLSTALHEFQGLAVLEAVALGCVPVVPDRLAYPELYPVQYRYASSPEDPGQEAAAAVHLIHQLSKGARQGSVTAPDIAAYTRAQLQPRYRQTLLATIDTQDSQ
jgi:glycosyltransferase involved in cell wall biosynthesis